MGGFVAVFAIVLCLALGIVAFIFFIFFPLIPFSPVGKSAFEPMPVAASLRLQKGLHKSGLVAAAFEADASCSNIAGLGWLGGAIYAGDGSCPAPPFGSQCFLNNWNFLTPCQNCGDNQNYGFSIQNNQLTVLMNTSGTWTDIPFNGMMLALSSGYKFRRAVLNNASTFTPAYINITTDHDGGGVMYIAFQGVANPPGVSMIVDFCVEPTAKQCDSYSSCSDCTGSGECDWCLDSNTCQSSKGDCHNFVSDPLYCPKKPCDNMLNCDDCVKDLGCGWCLNTQLCVESKNTTCQNEVTDKQYCNLG